MPILAIVESTVRNIHSFSNMSDDFGFRIFINFGKNTYFASLEPSLSNLHQQLSGKDKTSAKIQMTA